MKSPFVVKSYAGSLPGRQNIALDLFSNGLD